MKYWPIILGMTFGFTVFCFLQFAQMLSWLVKTNLNQQTLCMLGYSICLHLAKNSSICLNRMYVLVFFIQLTNTFESSLDVRLCSGSEGYGEAVSQYAFRCHSLHRLVIEEADIAQWSEHPSVSVMCMGNSIWVFSLCRVNMRAWVSTVLLDVSSQYVRGSQKSLVSCLPLIIIVMSKFKVLTLNHALN